MWWPASSFRILQVPHYAKHLSSIRAASRRIVAGLLSMALLCNSMSVSCSIAATFAQGSFFSLRLLLRLDHSSRQSALWAHRHHLNFQRSVAIRSDLVQDVISVMHAHYIKSGWFVNLDSQLWAVVRISLLLKGCCRSFCLIHRTGIL